MAFCHCIWVLPMLVLMAPPFSNVDAFLVAPPCINMRRSSAMSLAASSKFDADDAFEAGIRRRLQDVASSDAAEAKIAATGEANLPVIAFDALLPNQRLTGSTEDPTFARFLGELGLGGLFVMTSVNYKRRQLRRSGVVTRIELVDVERVGSGGPLDPTSVSFAVVGKQRCRLVGPAQDMKARVGRWRRVWDPDGEEALLGWGEERIVDLQAGAWPASPLAPGDSSAPTEAALHHSEWSSCAVRVLQEEDAPRPPPEVVAHAERLLPLLDRWLELASDPRTYDNVDVVAAARQQRGQPGLSVDPQRLLQAVLDDLGPRPTAAQPSALALWGAALINPLPALGVSVEVRGAMLEAPGPAQQLTILERGLQRSIWNLDGTAPLSPY